MKLPLHVAVHALACARPIPGGVATATPIGSYVECLAESVERVTLIAYDPPSGSSSSLEDTTEYEARPTGGNIELLSLGPKGTWRSWPERRRRAKAAVTGASSSWDLVLFQLLNRRAGLVARMNRCPRVAALVGGSAVLMSRSGTSHPTLTRRVRRWVSAWWADRVSRRILNSAGIACANGEELVELFRQSVPHVRLLRSSTRRSRYSYQPHDRLAATAEILTVGRLDPAKGVFEILRAFAQVRATIPAARLHVAGTGPAEPAMRDLARELGVEDAVQFHGWVPGADAMSELYRGCDVLLHLSHAESLPRTVWESLAHGVLVVCTPVGSLPKAFTDRREVMFTPLRDPAAAARAVLELHGDPSLRQTLLRAGHDRAQESTLEGVIGQLLEWTLERWPELQPATPRS